MFCKDSSDSERSGSAVRRRSRHHGVSVQNGPIVLGFSAFRRARRMRHQKRMTKEEYHRLKHMVPSVSSQARVSKVQVIEEAIKYIDSLHMALFQRLKAQEIAADDGASHPSDAAGGRSEIMINDAERDPILLREWIERVMPIPSSAATKLFQERQNQQQRERCKDLPSFLEKVDRMARKRPN